ncbi:MAG: penicillin-binding transpeptidase domain-containing protein [Lachnospiraceae bacterium]|nr:penicillin-binding transpeptidase domain-containing protein [Lachnospiraceae bacterium]
MKENNLKKNDRKEWKEKKAEEKRLAKERRAKGKEYVIVSYLFVAIFLSLIGYLVYFNVVLKDDILASPYNKRQDSASERVVRGDIKSLDGETLATTNVGEDGKETRYYPFENMFAQVVGYSTNGKSGLETLANYQLLSSNTFILDQVQNDFSKKKNAGDTVVTTLSVKLQRAAYKALGDYDGAVVVLEPKTGKILAMVSKPDFNPNTIGEDWADMVEDKNNSALVNRATQGAYPPGSIFKIVTSLAYLREKGTLDGFSFDCVGELTSEDHTIHCYNNNAHGQEDFATAFAKSCNSAFAQIGLDINGNAINKAANDLLFNAKLPYDLEYNKSKFALDNNSGDALTMQTAIGQGNTLTSPYHMALIVSAIANNGTLMEPYLIDHVENTNGDVVSSSKSKEYKALLTPSEAQTLQQLMEGVVTGGTGSKLNGNGYTAAGKTGSAEYSTADGTGTHSWFVGYSNVESPDIVVAVIAEGAGTGSEVAVPIASQIFDAYYYD